VTEISDWSDIEAQLQENKELLAEIEQRFLQVRRDELTQSELQSQQEQIKSQIKDISGESVSKIRRKPSSMRSPSSSHKEDLLKQLQEVGEQLEQIEANLESHLLSWSSFREPFWQIVRFVGIGIIIGVVLRSCAN
jgi:DnaJ-domain-containing protein 1